MGLLSRAIVWMQFKLGTYQARQITKIERGGVVIDCADSRYQPSYGIRYELSPDEWFLYSYQFFPRNHREDFYDENLLCVSYIILLRRVGVFQTGSGIRDL